MAAQVPVLLLAAALPPWTSRAAGASAHPVQYLGVLLLFAGVAAGAAGVMALRPALTPFPYPRRGATLVTGGIYRFIRHPMYSGLVAASLGWALTWLSPPGVLYVVLVALFFDRKAAYEEARLRECYPGYAAYAKRVRRFVPGIY